MLLLVGRRSVAVPGRLNPTEPRLIGSIRQQCLAHGLGLHEPHLRRILTCYFAYYHGTRAHLSLEKDAPDGRPLERLALGRGRADA